MIKLVCGVGINDGSIKATLNGKMLKEYDLWKHMLLRVYSKPELKKHPSYTGCSISNTFIHYHLFHKWCQTQIGFGIQGYELDKDLLIKGNKVYSEDNCIFIPRVLNTLILKRTSSRGLLPIGVNKHGSRFQASCSVDGRSKYIGMYDTPELAFQAYKTFKEAYIKEQAELYKDSIDPRAYLALLNYEVDIDD